MTRVAAPEPRRATSQPGAVFWHALQEAGGGILLWGILYSGLVILSILIYPILRRNNVLLNLLANVGILDFFSGSYGVEAEVLVSLKGYLDLQVLGWGPLILALYIIPSAAGLILDEERRGTLDLLLSAPLPRWRLLVEKTLALLVSIAAILAIFWLALLVLIVLVPTTDLTAGEATRAVWHMMPICSVIAGVGLLASMLVRQPRTAAGMAAAFVIISYFLRAMADSTQEPRLLALRNFSIFRYFSEITVFTYGPQPQWDGLLFTVTLILLIISLIAFQRRDIEH